MSKTVLHADDSASVRRWVAEQLGDLDLKVISVADGEAALEVLQGIALRPAADRPGDAQPRRPVPGGGRARPADASLPARPGPVLPATRRVPTGDIARE